MKFAKAKKLAAVFAALVVAASVSTTALAAQPSADTPPTAVLAASQYTIVSGSTSGGKISPEGTINANHGDSKTFSIIPDAGYTINEVIVNGQRKGAISSYTFSNISSSHSILASFRSTSQTAYTTNLLKTDTRSYKMSPNNIYDARITVEGQKFNQGNVRVYSSRDGIASVQRVTNDTYRIRGLKPGTTYIVAEAGNTHASIRVDVINGVKQGGEACRSVSIIGLDSTPIDYTTPTITPPTSSASITAERAKQIATQHAGISNPTFVNCKLDRENGRLVYEVEFYSGNKEYDYEIDAATGAIVTYDMDIENFNIPATNTNATYIGEARARQIAMQDANVSNPTFHKTKLERENGRMVYEVEFYSGNREFDYEIDAVSGVILHRDYDIENFNIPNTNTTTPSTGDIGSERAKQIALTHANLSASQVWGMKVEQDYEQGMRIYEVEFDYGRTEYTYEINAANGEIIKFEQDND